MTITKYINIRKTNLSVSISGDGKPFIWAHGIIGSCEYENDAGIFNWDCLEDFIRPVRYDARGHGRSEASFLAEDYSWNKLALDLIGVADALGMQKFFIGGTSMGCASALYAALSVPERVYGLVLANIPIAWELRAKQAEIYQKYVNIIEENGFDGLLDILDHRPVTPFILNNFPHIQDVKRKHYHKINKEAISFIYKGAALSNLPRKSLIRSLRVPTQILAWVDDPGHPVAVAREVNHLISNSRLNIAKGGDDVLSWPQVVRHFFKSIIAK